MDESLSFESLFEGAKKAAHRAIDDHGKEEYDEFALHAGVAVEKLVKAVLVSKNPVYIAEIRSNSADMVMYLGGHIQVAEAKVRTVGAAEAIKRLRKIGVLQPDSQLDLLIEMRNGAVHTSPDSGLAKGMISPFARTIETLLNDLGRPMVEYWERWTDTVKNAVNEREDQVLRDIHLRIAQARHRLDDRLAGLPLPEEVRSPKRPGFSFAFVTGDPDADVEVVSVTGDPGCPACGRQALVTVERSSTVGGPLPVALTCPWCQLHLNSAEEIRASGTEIGISLDVADDVFHGDYD